jgi:hypothetical protein
MGGENLSLLTPCCALFRHWSPSRGVTTSVVPRNSRGSALSNPRRPGLDPPPVNKEARPACHRIRGVRGWPAILGARRYSDFHSTRQNFTSNASPGVSASSWPYKREDRGLYKGRRGKKSKPSHHPTIEDQHLKQSPLYSLSLRSGIGSLSRSL